MYNFAIIWKLACHKLKCCGCFQRFTYCLVNFWEKNLTVIFWKTFPCKILSGQDKLFQYKELFELRFNSKELCNLMVVLEFLEPFFLFKKFRALGHTLIGNLHNLQIIHNVLTVVRHSQKLEERMNQGTCRL